MASFTLLDLPQLAQEIIKEAASHKGGAYVITLSGELGAGKTTFAQVLASELGVPEVITSPTFVIEKTYLLPEDAPFQRLIHIDAYRLERTQDLITLGWPDKLADPGNLIVLEWPERVAEAVPDHAYRLSFRITGESEREITQSLE